MGRCVHSYAATFSTSGSTHVLSNSAFVGAYRRNISSNLRAGSVGIHLLSSPAGAFGPKKISMARDMLRIPDGGLTVPSVTAYKSDPKDISPDKRYLSFPHACLFKRQNVSEYRDVSEYIIGPDCTKIRRQPAIISQGSLAIRHGADAIAGPNLAETRKAGLL